MSRSYRKHYIFKTAGDKSMKKVFNRRLRRKHNHFWEDIPSGNAYKKYNNTWDIADYIFRYDNFNDFWLQHEKYYASKQDAWRDWKKWFKGK